MQAAKRGPSAALGRRGKAQAQSRRGAGLQRAGQLTQALDAYGAAIALDPTLLEAMRGQAATLASLGKHQEAVAAWQRVRSLRPHDGPVARHLGEALLNAGRTEEALSLLVSAAQRHPDEPDLLTQAGKALIKLNRPKEAVGALLMAQAARPGHADTLSSLGIAFLNCNELDQACSHGSAAFEIAPGFETAINLSRILLAAGQFDAALLASEHALGLRMTGLPALINKALALEGLGRYEAAVQAWRASIALAPDNPELHHSLATLLLLLGRLTPDTWQIYERRFGSTLAAASVRRWRGEDVAGRTVLLHAEQGLGDTLQFVRYAPLVAARGARVVLAVQPSLMRLLAAVPGVAQVVASGTAYPPYDVVCPMLSLPAIFETTPETIPPPLPYDIAYPARAPGALRVGLVWAGNPGFLNDHARSVPPSLFAPLARLPNISACSLQFGDDATASALGLPSLLAGGRDFADTAARIAGLDLVITVDTAVCHLAATMGKPVWLLSRFSGCWRWLLDRPDSPWYPSIRIFRQTRTNDWQSVIDRVRGELEALAQS